MDPSTGSSESLLTSIWLGARNHLPFADHILFPSLVALTSFHLNCGLFTLYDAFVLKRTGVKHMLWDCALPQIVAHGVLNTLTFMLVDTRRELPLEAPDLLSFIRDVIACYFIGDFLIYVEHVIMHRTPWLRHNIHSTHHKYTSPMFSYCAGWVHPVEIAAAAVCELAYPLAVGVHPLTLWFFLYTWVFWLVEEHSGDDFWWSLWHIAPKLGGGAPPHSLHHAPHLTKNFGFVFSCWDRMFSTFEAPVDAAGTKLRDHSKQN